MSQAETRLLQVELMVGAYAVRSDVDRSMLVDALEDGPLVSPAAEELLTALRAFEDDRPITWTQLELDGLSPDSAAALRAMEGESWQRKFDEAAQMLRAARALATIANVLSGALSDIHRTPLEDRRVADLSDSLADTLQGLGADAVARMSRTPSAREHFLSWWDEHAKQLEHGGCTWGSDELDQKAGKFARGTVTCVAGLPGHGKSVLGMNAARKTAEAGKRVLYVCLEMLPDEQAMRLGCNSGEVFSDRLSAAVKAGNLEVRDRIASDIPDGVDLRKCHLKEARALVRQAHARGEPYDFVVLDYLQMFNYGNERDNEAKRLQDTVYFIKEQIAMKYPCGVLLLCQFSKQEDGTRMPLFRNVRGASAIEDAADVAVCILTDPEPTDAAVYGPNSHVMQFSVQKFRQGRTCKLEPYPSVRMVGGQFRIQDPAFGESVAEEVPL